MKFENLQGDFDTLCAQLGLPRMILPFIDKSRPYLRPKPDEHYYDDGVIEIVSKTWIDDLRRFDYSYDNFKICKLRQRKKSFHSFRALLRKIVSSSGLS